MKVFEGEHKRVGVRAPASTQATIAASLAATQFLGREFRRSDRLASGMSTRGASSGTNSAGLSLT